MTLTQTATDKLLFEIIISIKGSRRSEMEKLLKIVADYFHFFIVG